MRRLAIMPLLLVSLVISVVPLQPSATARPQASSSENAGQSVISVGPKQGAFLILSDLHFDPFAEPSLVPRLAASPASDWSSIFRSSRNNALSRNSRDSSYWLLASAIGAARDSGVPYDYVLVTGDYLAHDFRAKYRAQKLTDKDFQTFTIKAMTFVSGMIQTAFPGKPVLGALGNNDSMCDDYGEPPKSALFSALAADWNVIASHRDAARDFASGGFYAVPHPMVAKQQLIVLNTTFWATRYHPGCVTAPQGANAAGDPGAAEIGWLRQKLQETQRAGKTAVLIMHIPPGMDAYNSSTATDCNTPRSLWKDEYADAFLETIAQYRNILRDSYAGHIHRDDFRVFSDRGVPFLQMHIAPSISPIYMNNPAFEIGLYDKTNGALADYSVVYLANYAKAGVTEPPDWIREYDFKQAYHSQAASPVGLEAVAAEIRTQPAIRAQFLDFYSAHQAVSSIVATKDWRFYSCAQTQIRAADFARCACPAPAAK